MTNEQIIGIIALAICLLILQYTIAFDMLRKGNVFSRKIEFYVAIFPFLIYPIILISIVIGGGSELIDKFKKSNAFQEIIDNFKELK